MYIQQLYTACLSEAAYYIESNGEAAIIDPLRDIEVYLNLAKERGAVIKYVFETHFHADFVSGHIDLAEKTGAPIVYGPGAKTRFKIHQAKDGERFLLGNLGIELLHTPGHTLESSCYLLYDEMGKPHALFTGDTLFVGDVGRPDLSSGQMSSEELAGILFESIQQKIMPLSDAVIIYPAHGAGSSCGKQLGPETFSTLGKEKQENYALKQLDKETFVATVTNGLAEIPRYFPLNAKLNSQGYESIDEIMENGLHPISIDELKEGMASNAIILDTRTETEFTEGFIPGSIFIGLNGRFAEWAGILLPYDKPIYLVTEPGKEKESIIRLTRVGFDQISGFLSGGFNAWKEAGETIDLVVDIEADELMMDIPFDPNLMIVDVRKESEFEDGHLAGAVNFPLKDFTDLAQVAAFDDQQQLYVHCGGGYRSVIACSIFKKQGIHTIRNVLGGWNAIKLQKKAKIVSESNSVQKG